MHAPSAIKPRETMLIPVSNTERWQDEFQRIITDSDILIERLGLPKSLKSAAKRASALFPLRVTEPYLNRIERNNVQDPLLKQILPLGEELLSVAGASNDPVGEQKLDSTPGLIQKYHGRVLLMVSSQCVINCRYCFRRHFPYQEHHLNRSQWQAIIEELKGDQSISEVILSGGDPLSIADNQLQWLTNELAQIAHIKRLRVHTRLPIMVPSRITEGCIQAISHPNLKTIVVIHCNHAQELDHSVNQALMKLFSRGITLLNQSVLLRGINDCANTLTQLSETLFQQNVLPYYLHKLDHVTGASHFLVEDARIKQLYQELEHRLPGYLVPKLVVELAGERSKTRL